MNIKTLSFVSLGIILTAALAVGFVMSRPAMLAGSQELPVFMGEEVVVQKAEAVKVLTSAKAVKAIKAVKTDAALAPQPEVATPLPVLPPRIAYSVLPQYPAGALEKGVEGTVILSIYVGLSGDAEKVEVRSSSGAAELDASAVAAVSSWKFSPATQGGSMVTSWLEFPVRFSLK